MNSSIMSINNAIIHQHPRQHELSYRSLSLIFDFFSSSSAPTTSIEEKDDHHQYQYQSSSIASILQFGSVCKRWRDAMKNFCSVETWQRLARCYVVRNPFSNNDDADNQHHNDTESILRNIIISECKTYYDFFELGNYFIPLFPRPLSTTEIQHSSLFLKNTPLGDRGDQCPDIKSCRDTYLKTREDARAQQIAPANYVSGERFPALLLSSLQVKCRCCHQMMTNNSSSSCANPAPPPRLTRNLLRTNMLFEGLPILFDPERLHHPKNNGRIFCIASKKNISTAAQVPGNCCVDLTSTGNDLHHRFHNNNHPQSGIADMVMKGNTFVGNQVYIALVVKDPYHFRCPENGDRGAELVSHMLTHFFRSRTKNMVPGTRFLTRNHLQYRPVSSNAIVNLVVVENDSNNDINTTSTCDDNHDQGSSSSAPSSLRLKSDTLRATFSTLCNPASPDCPRIEWSFVIVFPGAGKINFDKTSQLKRLRREHRVTLPSNLISLSKNTPTPFVTAITSSMGSDEALINNEAAWIDIDPSYSKNLLYYVMGLVGDWLGVFEVERRNSRLGRKLRVMQGLNDAVIPKEEHDDDDDEEATEEEEEEEEEEEQY